MNNLYKIYISKTAKNDLSKIYEYCSNISYNYAEKIKNKLLISISSLKLFPRAFPKVRIYKNQKVEFRYLISNNYKILYLINQKFVIIQKIYICKQNPPNKL